MMDIKQKPFQLKGSLFTLTILQLNQFNQENFNECLDEMIQQAPRFFKNAPIVIDLHSTSKTSELDFSELTQRLRSRSLIPVGICGGDSLAQENALKAGLAILPSSKGNHTPLLSKEEPVKAPPQKKRTTTPSNTKTRIITQPVRSGQQIYAKDSDLIVLSSVSPGAELLADGNIHVYGPLHGRALAGINNNRDARIFCKELNAELISIAGLYQLSEDFSEKANRFNVQIYLNDDKLHVENIT